MVATEGAAPAQAVVSDAGPLIHLDELSSVDLLSDFVSVLVPEAVWQEVERHRPGALRHPAVRLERVHPPATLPPDLEALSRMFPLHRGETEALAVAAAKPGAILLTDDTAARLAAKSLGVAVHGTLGILVRAIRRRQRTLEHVIATLRSLPSVSTLHLKRSLLEDVIREIEAASDTA